MKNYIIKAFKDTFILYGIYQEKKDIFLPKVTRKNKLIIFFASVSAIFFQITNILRVFSSNSKLTTFNNRIYFAFYLSLLIVSIFIFCVQVSKKVSDKKLYLIQYLGVAFYVYWNLLLNSYNITRTVSNSSTIFMSALLFCSVLLRFKPHHIIFLQVTSFLGFLTINQSFILLNGAFDITIIFLSAIFCSVVLFFQEVRSYQNEDELFKINTLLNKEQDKLRLSLEKYNYIINKTNVLSFEWDLENDILTPSNNCIQVMNISPIIANPKQRLLHSKKIHEEDKEKCLELFNQCRQGISVLTSEVRFSHKDNNYHWYELQMFVQSNQEGNPTIIIGTLLNVDKPIRLINNLNKQLTTQLEGSKQYLNQLKDSQEKTKIYRHDMRHSLALIEQIAATGDMDKLCAYLSESHHNLDALVPNQYCENDVANLILSSFESRASNCNIEFQSNISLPNSIELSDTELSALLFNLLENAMIAAKKSKQENRFIKIKATYHLNKLLLFVENSYQEAIHFDEDNVPISPNNKEEHGFGTKSVIAIAEKYDGMYSFDAIDSIFYAKIMLSINKEQS